MLSIGHLIIGHLIDVKKPDEFMNYKAFSKLLFVLISLVWVSDISAQAQRIFDASQREFVNACSTPRLGGGFYTVNIFSDPTFASSDSTGINIIQHDAKGDFEWTNDYLIDDATYLLGNRSVECTLLVQDTLLIVVSDASSEDNSGSKFLMKIEPDDGEIIWTQTISDVDGSDNMRSYASNPKVLNGILEADEMNYFATHDAQDTVGIHWEQFDAGFETTRSQSYYAMTLDTLDSLQTSISLYDIEITRDTGLVMSIAVGDNLSQVGIIDLDSLGTPRQAASYIAADSSGLQLEFTAITPTADGGFVAAGFCQHTANPRSIVVKVDTALNVQWSNMLIMPGDHIAGDVIISETGNIVVGGRYLDGITAGNYSVFLDNDGEIITSAIYENDHSLFANLTTGVSPIIDLSNDPMNMTIHMTTTGVMTPFTTTFRPMWINMDQMGGAMCHDTLSVNSEVLGLARDTLGIRNTVSPFVERSELEVRDTSFRNLNLLVLDLQDTTFCPQDPVIFTIDATTDDATSYLWSTEEITPMITVNEIDMYSVTVTIDDQICYSLCDTTEIFQLPFPTIQLNVQDDSCDNRELTYSVGVEQSEDFEQGDPRLEIVSTVWLDSNRDTISTATSITVPSEAGTDYAVRIIDSCGNPADTSFRVPDLTPNLDVSFVTTAENLCEDGELQLAVQWPGGNTPLEYLWNTGDMTAAIDVASPGGTFTVTVTDACNYVTEGEFTLEPEEFEIPSPTVDINTGDVNCDLGVPAITLTAEVGNLFTAVNPTILWSTQATSDIITVIEPGIYSVTVTVCDSTAVASVEIIDMLDVELPTINITPDGLSSTSCDLGLTANTNTASGITSSIVWSTNELGPNIRVDEAGVFTATITDMCGQSAEASITVAEEELDFADPTVSINSFLSTDVCEEVLQANASSPAGVEIVSFLWSDGTQGDILNGVEPGDFTVTVTDNCGNTGMATATAGMVSDSIQFPNIFFPNSQFIEDNNNTFGPFTNCPQLVDNYNLKVFNRWGKRVFETESLEQRWSGSQDNMGARLAEDVYTWIATYNSGGEEFVMHGDVTMIRQ